MVSQQGQGWNRIHRFAIIIGVWVCVLLLGEGLARFVVHLGQPSLSHSKLFDEKYRLASAHHHAASDSVLLIGDSFMSLGVYPELLQRRFQEAGLPLTVLNLGVLGNSADMTLQLLKTAVDAGKQPKLVVLDVADRLLDKRHLHSAGGRFVEETALQYSYLGRCVMNTPTQWEGKLDCTLSKASYLFRYRNFLNQLAQKTVTILQDPNQSFSDAPFAAGQLSPLGWTPYAAVFTGEETVGVVAKGKKSNKAMQPGGADNLFDKREFTGEMIRPIVDYCKAKQIPLVLVWMPEHTYMDTHLPAKKRAQRMAEIDQLVALAKQWNVPFLNFRTAVANPNAFRDAQHLNVVGALQFTNQLADTLLQSPRSPLLAEERGAPAGGGLRFVSGKQP